jgi:hypothetical protein
LRDIKDREPLKVFAFRGYGGGGHKKILGEEVGRVGVYRCLGHTLDGRKDRGGNSILSWE